YFPHDHARSRAFRWNEDGLAGLCDRHQHICFALALWNRRDPFLKERLFGLSNHEGNHGEDVKECYFFLDNTPTHSYMKCLYKYPQQAFPYEALIRENGRRTPRLRSRTQSTGGAISMRRESPTCCSPKTTRTAAGCSARRTRRCSSRTASTPTSSTATSTPSTRRVRARKRRRVTRARSSR